MNKKAIGERAENQTGKFAVYQKKDGALCVLSNYEAQNSKLVKVSADFRSFGMATIQRLELERSSKAEEGKNAQKG